MNLTILTNSTFKDEMALYNNDKKEMIVKGDCYHDRIYAHIQGIIVGIKYCNIEVNVNHKIISPEDELFEICKFYNDDY